MSQSTALSLCSLGFKPVHYDLLIDICQPLAENKRNFNGEAKIVFERPAVVETVESGKIDKQLMLVLNSNGLVIRLAALSTGAKAKVKYDTANQRVEFIFAEVSESQLVTHKTTKIELNLSYLGKLSKINTPKEKTSGIFFTNYMSEGSLTADKMIVATQSQPCDSRRIFPCIDDLSQKASFSLKLKMSSSFAAASNTSIETSTVDDSSRIVTFKRTRPMVISLFSFVCGHMEFVESILTMPDNSKLPLRVFTLVGSLYKAAYSLKFTSEFLPIMSSKFCVAYPDEKIDLVALPFLSNGAVENYNLVYIQQDILLVSPAELEAAKIGSSNKIRQLNRIIVHELAHQWFGNTVSLDSWKSYWLNESLATFIAYSFLNDTPFNYDGIRNPDFQEMWMEQSGLMESTFLSDQDALSISEESSKVNDFNVSSIDQTCDPHTYEKGIHLLRMFSKAVGSSFNKLLGQLAAKYRHQVIKPVDFWLFFDGESKLKSLTNMIMSWLKLPGFPVVEFSLTEEGLLRIEQHRQLTHPEDEDYIYHVPITIMLKDGSASTFILDTRSKIFNKDELDSSSFLLLEDGGFYKTDYRSFEFYTAIASNITSIPKGALLKFLQGIESYIGTERAKNYVHVKGFVEVLKSSTENNVPFEALEVILRIVQFLASNIQLFRGSKDYRQFKKYLNNLCSKLLTKFNLENERYSRAEIVCLNMVLTLGVEVPEVTQYCQKLFEYLTHGPKSSVPREVLSSVLINYSYNITAMKNFKKLLQLTTRSSEIMLPNVSNVLCSILEDPVSVGELQTAAISSLGFIREPQLFNKVLNYIATNIDSKGIELALVGFNYFDNNTNYSQNPRKKAVFEWFKLNFYNNWGLRSLREGSDYSSQLYLTLHNIFEILVKNFTGDEDIAVLKGFIRDSEKKDSHYKKHRFHELMNPDTSREKTAVKNLDIAMFT